MNFLKKIFHKKAKVPVAKPKPIVFNVGDRVKFVKDYSYNDTLYYEKSSCYVISSIEETPFIRKFIFIRHGIFLTFPEMREYCVKSMSFKYGK
jgi:hypothetical protein